MHDQLNEAWRRYLRDRDDASFGKVVQIVTPAVRSVCRACLRSSTDVDDAVQETLIKLAAHADSVRGNVASWTTRVARTTSIDLIRRAASQRNTARALADIVGVAGPSSEWLRARERLPDMLNQLPRSHRRLLALRFLKGCSLNEIAEAEGVSLATASRRITRAAAELAKVAQDDELPLVWPNETSDIPLQPSPNWRSLGASSVAGKACRPGRSRSTRIGVVVSYTSSQTITRMNFLLPIEMQVVATRLCDAPGFELVGVAERGTTGYGNVERTLREFRLTAGLIDLEDERSLQTLDVILLGPVARLARGGLAAVETAVRAGVGLFNIGTCQGTDPVDLDPQIQRLMLSEGRTSSWHSPHGCGSSMPATVVCRHPVLPGVIEGTTAHVPACGAVYQAVPGSRVLMVKNETVVPSEPPGLAPQRMPALLAGRLGDGRVLVANMQTVGKLFLVPGLQENFLAAALDWLARPEAP